MSNDFRRQKRRTAPLDQHGRYAGDIQVAALHSFIELGKFCERWSNIAESMGYQPLSSEPTFPQRVRSGMRFVNVVLDAGIWYLSEVKDVLQDNSSRREFLDDVLACSTANGYPPVAVPHDILTFIVLHERRAEFLKEEIEHLGYNQELTDALLELLELSS